MSPVSPSPESVIAPSGASVSPVEVDQVIERALDLSALNGKRVLVIVPDATRTAPVGTIFKSLHRMITGSASCVHVLVALGTHQPMSRQAICKRLEIEPSELERDYPGVELFNHAWDSNDALKTIGTLSKDEINELSDGRFSMKVDVRINRMIDEYDDLIIIGPVFPHEVVGFSGGNKYFFPGISGPEVLNFFHWLGAVVTTPMVIGNKWTPVRKVVDRAASLIPNRKHCLAPVMDGSRFAGFFAGTPEGAWDKASDLSAQLNIEYRDKPFSTVLSCAPLMYDEIWVAAKCMYKLEPVVADGGELIIYAPHLDEVSVTHGEWIEKVGYHCCDYFLKQWDRFKDFPWGVLAHSAHVAGLGTYEDGVEKLRITVTLASKLSEETCRKLNLNYRDPALIDPKDYADREDERILLVPKAGERLFHLRQKPVWAGGVD